MTRDEFRGHLVQRIRREFSGSGRHPDGSHHPILDEVDCKFIADLCFGEIGRFGLRLSEKEA